MLPQNFFLCFLIFFWGGLDALKGPTSEAHLDSCQSMGGGQMENDSFKGGPKI